MSPEKMSYHEAKEKFEEVESEFLLLKTKYGDVLGKISPWISKKDAKKLGELTYGLMPIFRTHGGIGKGEGDTITDQAERILREDCSTLLFSMYDMKASFPLTTGARREPSSYMYKKHPWRKYQTVQQVSV